MKSVTVSHNDCLFIAQINKLKTKLAFANKWQYTDI